MLEHSIVSRVVERQQPAVLAVLFRVFGGACQHRLGQPLEIVAIRYVQRPRVGRVNDVVFELGLRRGERLHDLLEARLGVVLEVDAGKVKVTQGVIDGGAGGLRGIRGQVVAHASIRLLQGSVV